MKTTIFVVFFLCLLCVTSTAFGQVGAVLNSQAQPFEISGHPEHASQHSMGAEVNLFGSSPYSYERGEVPVAEFMTPIYHTPLGDVARENRKEHATLPKAVKTLEN